MKKEAYFTPESISERSREILDSARAIDRRREMEFRAGRSALLVLDMQAYFLQGTSHAHVPSASAILPRIGSLIEWFHAFQRPVIFTRHLNTQQDAGRMAGWWHDLLMEASPLSRIELIVDATRDTVIHKSQYDAFYKTALEEVLLAQAVSQVVICGVMTHLCCETTARAAFMRGFDVFFVVDATATYTEAFHRASILNLTHGFAVPVLTGTIVNAPAG